MEKSPWKGGGRDEKRIWPLLALMLLSACGGPGPEKPPELPPMARQELLFLQQGFRQHGVEGTCTVYFAPAGEDKRQELVLEDPEGKDVTFYQNLEGETFVDVAAGCYCIFFSNDIHRPGCAAGEPGSVRKAVVKMKQSLV